MRLCITLACVAGVACGRKAASPAAGGAPQATSDTGVHAAAPGEKTTCPADGRWHECSVIDRLDRSGLAPRRDSSAATEKELAHPGIRLHLGDDELEVFLYPDEAARAADEKKLDKQNFVEADSPYTMRHERTVIRSVNLLALLASLREHKRERVADALTAGPPQPARP